MRRMIGLVTEEPGLYDRLTVREHLDFFGRAQGLNGNTLGQRIELVVETLVLESEIDKRAGTLSKGNRQKVSLARAIIHDPPVLLLDEPTSGLDVMATIGLEDLLAAEEVTGDKTVLLSTHRLDEAERLANRIVGIVDGHVVAEGQPADLAKRAWRASVARSSVCSEARRGAAAVTITRRLRIPAGRRWRRACATVASWWFGRSRRWCCS